MKIKITYYWPIKRYISITLCSIVTSTNCLFDKNNYVEKFMETTRQNKISRLLQKELSEIFLLQTKAMPGVLVSVSAVRISPDEYSSCIS